MVPAFLLATLLSASLISAKLLNLPLIRHPARALKAVIDSPAENLGNELYVATIGVGSPPTNCKLIALAVFLVKKKS